MSGEPVVLIPPMLSDARVFLSQIAALSRDQPLITVPPSDAETLGQMADQVLAHAPATFALVGAAMGGMIALEIVNRAPERVTRLALINTTAQADTPKIAADRETHIIAAKAGRFGDVIDHELDPARLCAAAEVSRLPALMRQMGDAIGAETYIAQARAMQKRKDQQSVLRKIRQPAVVISGDSDPEMPMRRQEFIAEMIPYARHCVIENAGFMPMMEQPDQVSDALRDWLRQPLVLR